MTTINSAKEARAEKYREKGNEHFRQGKFPQALKKYTRSLDMCEDGRAYGNRAQTLLKLAHAAAWEGQMLNAVRSNYNRARSDANTAVKMLPGLAKGYLRLAFAHMGMGDFPRALAALEDGNKACPSNSAIRDCLVDLRSKGVSSSISNPYHQDLARFQQLAMRDHQLAAESPTPTEAFCGWCFIIMPAEFQGDPKCMMCRGKWAEKEAANSLRDTYLKLPPYAYGWGFKIPGRENLQEQYQEMCLNEQKEPNKKQKQKKKGKKKSDHYR